MTKADLGAADTLVQAYKTSGIPLVQLNYETGEGLPEIKAQIKDHLCAFCGNSGVGKSTLLNALAPELQRETGVPGGTLGQHENNHLDGITIMDLAEHFYEDDYPEENED